MKSILPKRGRTLGVYVCVYLKTPFPCRNNYCILKWGSIIQLNKIQNFVHFYITQPNYTTDCKGIPLYGEEVNAAPSQETTTGNSLVLTART